MRAGHRQHRRMHIAYHHPFRSQTTRHDDLAVFRQGLTNRIHRFGNSRIDEVTGIDHDQVGSIVGGGNIVTFGAKAGKNLLGINQGLETPSDTKPTLGAEWAIR